MKKLIAVAGLGAALIVSPLLTSCASAGASSGAEDRFIARLDDGGIHYSSEAQAIKTGHSVCKALDAGADLDTAIYEGSDASGYSIHDTAYIVGASIRFFCDEYGYLVS